MAAPALGAGVEFDSDAASVEASTFSVGTSLTGAGGVTASGVGGLSSLAGFSAKRASLSGERRKIAILEPFLPLSDFDVDMEGDRMAGVAFDMTDVDDVMSSGW